MKMKFNKAITVILLLLATAVHAQQRQGIEVSMANIISRISDSGIKVDKKINIERDVTKEGMPMKSRCDIYSFTLPKRKSALLDEMIKSLESESVDNPNCYNVNNWSRSAYQDNALRNLMIGDDMQQYVTIGRNYANYLNVNILDASDVSKMHRYAYALEWSESNKGGKAVRYIVTYAMIPALSANYAIPTDMAHTHASLSDDRPSQVDSCLSTTHTHASLSDDWNDSTAFAVFDRLSKEILAGKNTKVNALSIYNLLQTAGVSNLLNDNGITTNDIFTEAEQKEMSKVLRRSFSIVKDETTRQILRKAYAELQKGTYEIQKAQKELQKELHELRKELHRE